MTPLLIVSIMINPLDLLKPKYIKLDTKTQFFLITFDFVIHFKNKTFFSPSVFLSPLSKCIKKSSNFHLNDKKKFGF